MADDTLVFENDQEMQTFWLECAELVGDDMDWRDASLKFKRGEVDLLEPKGDQWAAYALRPADEGYRVGVREMTKRLRKGLLNRSLA